MTMKVRNFITPVSGNFLTNHVSNLAIQTNQWEQYLKHFVHFMNVRNVWEQYKIQFDLYSIAMRCYAPFYCGTEDQVFMNLHNQ